MRIASWPTADFTERMGMRDDLNELTGIIEDATVGISPAYFLLPIAGAGPKYRERVYCYELYHQMRLLWPRPTKLQLNGEVDKVAHPILKECRAKPDLLVHQSGSMDCNYAVIEVKPSDSKVAKRRIIKDLETLSRFKRECAYQRAIYLIYGNDTNCVKKRIEDVASNLPGLAEIELWLHEGPEQKARHITNLGQAVAVNTR